MTHISYHQSHIDTGWRRRPVWMLGCLHSGSGYGWYRHYSYDCSQLMVEKVCQRRRGRSLDSCASIRIELLHHSTESSIRLCCECSNMTTTPPFLAIYGVGLATHWHQDHSSNAWSLRSLLYAHHMNPFPIPAFTITHIVQIYSWPIRLQRRKNVIIINELLQRMQCL